MDKQVGRSTGLFLCVLILVVVGLVVWADEVATDGQGRRTLIGYLSPGGRTKPPGRLVTARDPEATRPRSGNRAGSRKEAEEPPAPEIDDANASCTIAGLVLNEEREPVAGARISVRGPRDFERSTDTGADGRFSVVGLPTGTFDVFARHNSYVPMVRPGFTLREQGQIASLDFELPLGATLRGIVKDEEGKPLSGVRVLAHRRKLGTLDGGDAYIDDTAYKTEKSDRDGTFTVTGVALGRNVVEFYKAGYEGVVKDVTVKAAKEQPKLEITLRRTGTLAGRVVDEAGNPVSTVTVHLVRYKPIRGPAELIEKGKITATAGEDGRFEFKKLYTEGFYDLHVDDERFAPSDLPLVPVGASEVAVTVGQGGVISGKAQYIDRPQTVASVLIVAETVTRGTTFTKEVKSDGTGFFEFTRLPYGKYNLSVRTSGLASEPKRDVAVERGKPARDVVVEVYEASTVKGRVADGRDDGPVPGAMVTIEAVYGPNGTRRRTFQTRADQHGGFAFYRMPAGAHVARASARGFLQTITDRSETRFTLQPGERKADLALVLDRGGVVDGFVISDRGRPVEGADVQLYAASNLYGHIDTRALKARTDGTGHFVISGIEVREHTQFYASARHHAYAKASSKIIDLTPRKPEATTQIFLSPGGVVTGRVTDKNDLPVPGALLRFDSGEFPGDPSPSVSTAQARPDGTYVLTNVPPGSGTVTVSRSGYVRQARGVSVKESGPTGNVNFKLEPGQQISGTVAALDGTPIAGARVSAAGLEGAAGSDEAVTDRNGRFTLSNLGAGAFRLTASFKLSTPDGDQFYAFVNPRVMAGDTTADIDCDVGNVLTGLIVDEENRGIDAATVSLRSRGDTKPAQDFVFNLDRRPRARGSFYVLNIPRGLYTMKVTASGYEPYIQEDLAIGPTPRTDLPRIKLRSAGGIGGTLVSSSTNRPVNGVQVRLIDTLRAGIEAQLNASSGVSDASGKFRITTALEGTYDVEFSHPSYMPLRVEKVKVTRRTLTDLGRLYLEAGGAIRGTVTDQEGQPVRGLHVKVSGLNKAAWTDYAGNYLIQGVQAGRWNVIARGNVHGRTVYSWQVAAVQPDETETLDFLLETSADLDGLLAAAGDVGQVKTGDVRIHPFDENAIVLEDIHYDATASPADSTFEIRQVPPGPYFLWASGIGAANAAYTAWQTLNLNRGRNETIVRVGTGALEGKAVEAGSAQPVKDVGIQLRPLFESLRLPQGIYDKLVRSASTGADGTYAFRNLQAGPYQMLYRPPEGGLYAQPPFTLHQQQVASNYDVIVPIPPE